MKRHLAVLVAVFAAAAESVGDPCFNVRKFGAVGDGLAKDTAAIQAAIDAAEKAGGGEVYVPAGMYLTGSLYLKDNVDFHLGAGALVRGSPDKADYSPDDVCPQNWSCWDERASGAHLLLAIERKNVRVRGPGRIDGNMRAFNLDASGRMYPPTQDRQTGRWHVGIPWRPAQMLYFVECENVRLEDLKLTNAPYWSCFVWGCEDVWIRGLDVSTSRSPRTHNGDGIDIDSCLRVTVSDCHVRTTDDAITLRASNARLKKKRDCAYVTIQNCVLSSLCDAFRLGVGTGRIHDVTVTGCSIYDSRRAVDVVSSWNAKSERGVSFENIRFSNLTVDAVDFCWVYPRFAKNALVRNLTFEGVTGTVRSNSYVSATNGAKFENIVFRNVDLPGAVDVRDADVRIEGGTVRRIESDGSDLMRHRVEIGCTCGLEDVKWP